MSVFTARNIRGSMKPTIDENEILFEIEKAFMECQHLVTTSLQNKLFEIRSRMGLQPQAGGKQHLITAIAKANSEELEK